eukprot:Hpha_TRINITY_DN15329_c3_g1::TRINITY_DN15329_c3_g1_i1::g.89440::m.89440
MGRCKERFKAQNIGMALYGLRGCAGWPETMEILGALAGRIKHCADRFIATNIAMSIYGLGAHGYSHEARAVLEALGVHIDEFADPMSVQEWHMVLVGVEAQPKHAKLELLQKLAAAR